MKKILCLMVSLIIFVSFCGCNGSNTTDSQKKDNASAEENPASNNSDNVNADVTIKKSVNDISVSCTLCDDTKFLSCNTCDDNGYEICSKCNGEPIVCNSCNGYGSLSCGGCSGQGGKKCVSCNGTGTFGDAYMPSTFKCSFCGGDGIEDCIYCSGQGSITCFCGGDGVSECSTCANAGKIRCTYCGGDKKTECSNCNTPQAPITNSSGGVGVTAVITPPVTGKAADTQCWICYGNGECSFCDGSGRYDYYPDYAGNSCRTCNGSGKCQACNGLGYVY